MNEGIVVNVKLRWTPLIVLNYAPGVIVNDLSVHFIPQKLENAQLK